MALPFWLIVAPLAWIVIDSIVSKKTSASTFRPHYEGSATPAA